MFSIFKRNKSNAENFEWLGADMHSHLVPGIDDGAADMAAAVSLAKGLSQLGFKKAITTPHVLWEMYANTPQIIQTGCAAVKQQLALEKVELELGAAAEYFIDDHFESALAAKEPLLTLKDKLVLVEFSMITAPFDLRDTLFNLQMQNYVPIIAHPERYIYLRNKKVFFDELKESGALFQVNLLSLVGHYGTSVQELAEYLIKKEAYDFAGTDLHNLRQLAVLQKAAASPLLAKLKASQRLQNSLL